MTRVAIMQPTIFLEWILRVDAVSRHVVLLDSVQFARRSWQQRNQIKTVNGAMALSPGAMQGKSDQLIYEVELDISSGFAATHRRIEMSYAKTPHFKQYATTLLPLLNNFSPLLVDLTIGRFCTEGKCGHYLRVLRSSELNSSAARPICWPRCVSRSMLPPMSPRQVQKST